MRNQFAFLRWIENPSERHGMHFSRERDEWEFWSQLRLADLARRTAAALTARDVRRGDVVVLVHRSGPEFVASLFGAMLAGAASSSIAPPFAFQQADDYRARVSHMVRIASPAAMIADDDSAGYLTDVAAELGLRPPVRFCELIAEAAEPATAGVTWPADPRDVVLLQFTSGSSAPGRGVRIPASALDANVSAIMGWLRWSPGESGVTWMPVHHDMGLVGCLITPLAAGCDTWIMQPEEFIRTPLRYLRAISDLGSRMAAMPSFGLAYLINRVSPRHLQGLDFSALDAVIVGAERIRPGLLDSFHKFLAPFGFRREALLPAYGLAEATLCVTGLPVGEGWTSARMPVHAVGNGVASGSCPDVEVTGCGRPVAGIEVSVVDDDGAPVPDGVPGEIVVAGTSVADGYAGGSGSASATTLAGGVLRTGDVGFMSSGQLFVIGRMGDGLKMRGKMVFAESIEVALQDRGIPARRAAALLGFRGDTPVATVVLENAQDSWRDAVSEVLRTQAGGAELLIVDAPRGSIALTSSGKPRRRLMWQALTEGSLPGEVTAIQAPRPEVAARATEPAAR